MRMTDYKNNAMSENVTPHTEPTDFESEHLSETEASYDPFTSRESTNQLTDFEALVHVLKAAVCSGVLGMPLAFQKAGIVVGIIATIIVSAVCAYAKAILVESAHNLYHRLRVPSLTFAQVAEMAFLNGPEKTRKYSSTASLTIHISLFVTYFGTCSVYIVIMAYTIQQVLEYYTQSHVDSRVYIAALLVPLVMVAWVPNLKYMAIVSLVANMLMAVGLGITAYYFFIEMPSISERRLAAPIAGLPVYLSITIFALQAIGVIMPLENSMKTPQNFLGVTGVLSMGLTCVTAIYILIGFFGYLKYGDEVEGSITLSLPANEIPVQIVAIAIGLGIFFTYGLQFFVILEIAWDALKYRFTRKPLLAEYTVRTALAILTVSLATLVPTIGAFMGLIGALCFSLLGIMIPAIVQVITFWDEGFGYAYYRIWLNAAIIIFGMVAMLTGTYTSILEIILVYKTRL